MTNTLKSNEALSHGHIFDKEAKRKQSETIQQQIEEFFKTKDISGKTKEPKTRFNSTRFK